MPRPDAVTGNSPVHGDLDAAPILTPKRQTLSRYGLTVEAWRDLAARQAWACYVCRQRPRTGRLCVDHEHVKGWKKMPPSRRVQYVRGLLCWMCNHYYVGRGITVDKARRVAEYLEGYEARRRWETT